MLQLLKWLIFGHLHQWEIEERVTKRVVGQPSGKVIAVELTAYERCKCGAVRARRVY